METEAAMRKRWWTLWSSKNGNCEVAFPWCCSASLQIRSEWRASTRLASPPLRQDSQVRVRSRTETTQAETLFRKIGSIICRDLKYTRSPFSSALWVSPWIRLQRVGEEIVGLKCRNAIWPIVFADLFELAQKGHPFWFDMCELGLWLEVEAKEWMKSSVLDSIARVCTQWYWNCAALIEIIE